MMKEASLFLLLIGCANQGVVGIEGDAGTDAPSVLMDASLPGTDGGPISGMGGCSGDLHHVIDDKGNVIANCGNDQGCSAGKCIAACEAASASHGYVGCDVMLPTPPFNPPEGSPCFAAFIANNWPEDAKITVTRASQTYDATTFGRIVGTGSDPTAWAPVPSSGIPQGKVAVLFLSGKDTFQCPITPAINGPTAISTGTSNASGRGDAFHIVTNFPVTSYDILPYGGATSYLPAAELILPTSAWGTNYVATVAKRGPQISWGPQFAQIVASQDLTTVKIVPTTALPAGPGNDPPGATANTLATYTLNAGEFLQWQDTMEMTGSIIQSDKPIAFVGGDDYLCLPSKTSPLGGGCDSAHQMIPPISALGNEYVIAPFLTRRSDLADESILYRIVGTVAGTTLTFDPPVTGAPASVDAGAFADFETTGAFRVASQDSAHPFHIVQMMSGCPLNSSRAGAQSTVNCDGTTCLGDEDFVNVLPPAQFLDSYVFFTDPTYWTTNLALVRAKDSNGFHDVNVDCAGNVTGWKDVGTDGRFQVATLELVRSNKNIGACTNGQHTAKSDGAFGVTVWGEDCASSYGYPAGGNVATINAVVVPPQPK